MSEKSIYREARDNASMTRKEAVADDKPLCYMTEDKLEKIENGKTKASPEDVLNMQETYKSYDLCSKYCKEECAIGQKIMPKVVIEKNVATIVMHMLSTLNKLERDKDRIVEILDDGVISKTELEDFSRIQDLLEKISVVSHTLQMWVNENKDKIAIDEDE